MLRHLWRGLLALLLVVPVFTVAAVPGTLGFSARVADNGQPVTGSHAFVFTLWDVATGGTAGTNDIWTETQTLSVANGVVTAALGAGGGNPLPVSAFNGLPLYLEVSMDGTVFGPRMTVHSVPYAFRAAVADAVVGGGVAPESLAGTTGTPGQVPVTDGAGSFTWMTPAPSAHTHSGADVTSAVASASTATVATDLSCSGCVQDGEIQSVQWSKITGAPDLPRVAWRTSGATTPIGASCTNYSGGSVTITAPAAGTIVVRATAWVKLSHTNGTLDALHTTIGTTNADCGDAYGRSFAIVPAAAASLTYDMSVAPSRIFTVGAGTYTYYLNGQMATGQDASDVFWFARIDAQFIPN